MLKAARALGFRRWLGRFSLAMGLGVSLLGACSSSTEGDAPDPHSGAAAGDDSGGSSAQGGTGAKGGTTSKGGGGGSTSKGDGGASGEQGADLGGQAGADSTAGLDFPITLTPIGAPITNTAHVSLYFTATDAAQEPVPGLVTDQFVAKEDDANLDPFESAFRVTNPKGALVIPTVLLLDLSRSVLEAGALDDLKKAANQIIDNLDPAQRLAIVTFATTSTTRQTFTTDKQALHATIDAITMADGVATNLYGALIGAYGLWDDGFRIYDPTATAPQLVAGLMIAVSDGSDTAAISTLDDVVKARGTKRTIFIRIGEAVDESVPKEIANSGVILAKAGFADLETAVGDATDRISKLNGAIYAAEYCSPKRAGTHDLVFTVKGNESYITTSTSGTAVCEPSSSSLTCDAGSIICNSACCPTSTPFWCSDTNKCYQTAQAASSVCASKCIACGSASSSMDSTTAESGGPAITVSFSASAFSDTQCDDLFKDPPMTGSGGEGNAPGTGGTGTGGTATGGVGGTGGSTGVISDELAEAITACNSLTTAADDFCGATVQDILVPSYGDVSLSSSCGVAAQPCLSEYATLLKCLNGSVNAGQCTESVLIEAAGVCTTEGAALQSCATP